MKRSFLLIIALATGASTLSFHANNNYKAAGLNILGLLMATKGLSILLKQASVDDESISFRRTSTYYEDESLAWNLTNQANRLVEIVGAACFRNYWYSVNY